MNRGRGQVLFHFMPEQMADYPTGAIGKVESLRGKEITSVDMGRLLDAVQRSAARFSTRRRGFPRSGPWKAEDFVFLEPTRVELSMFPLTFFCKECSAPLRCDSVDDFLQTMRRTNYKCPKCRRGDLEQTEIVHYHTCGKLETLVIAKCDDRSHGPEYAYLDKRGSGSIREWRWVCRHPAHGRNGQELSPVGAWCFDHGNKELMPHNPFRAGDVYYPETVTLINAPPMLKTRQPDEKAWRVVVAEYLGIAPEGTVEGLDSPAVQDAITRAEARKALLDRNIPEEYLDGMLDAMRATLKMPAGEDEMQRIIGRSTGAVSLPGVSLSNAASKVYEYMKTTNGKDAKPIGRVLSEAQGPQAARIRMAQGTMRDLGIADAHVTSNFPIVKATYGYSRGDADRATSTLRAFPANEDFKDRTPIYGSVIKTEAIIISLDRKAVHEWLRRNSLTVSEPITDEADLKAWFLNNVDVSKTQTFEDLDDIDRVTKWVYRLTHTVSHVLLRQAASVAGIDRNSLGEALFPNIPALAIYSSGSEGASLGGMHSLFESSMASWLEAAADEVMYCLNDPSCIEGKKACFACLHLAEVSCEHFNRELGRDVLIGSPSGVPKYGFWSGAT